ncbi:MAG: tetratricopeptide repeat protein [Spirochaetaceae bacterium]|nr:tetratricopeptide repeat protein [Spirochaetaceae bacterium]
MNNDAEYWFNKGKELFNSKKLEEAISCYEKATKLNPDYADAFVYWGNALYELAEIEQDETLFRKAVEKYDKAIKRAPNHADCYYNLGNALFRIGDITKNETLYIESIEKFGKAAQIKPEYAFNFIYRGATFVKIAKIINSESLFKESINCFQKYGKDILHIFISLDENDKKYFLQEEILHQMLDMDTDDGLFFREITKGIKELSKYKEVYIRSIKIISNLHINNKYNDKSVAHYTTKTVSQKQLFEFSKFRLNAINYSNDPTEGNILLDYLFGKTKTPVRPISNIGYGAFAGCFIFKHNSLNQFRLYGKENGVEGTGLSLVFRNGFFSKEAQMPIKELKTDDNNLNEKEELNKYALFRCIYIDPTSQRVETVGHKEGYLFYQEKNEEETEDDIKTRVENYNEYIIDIIKNINKEMETLKSLVQNLDPEVVGQLLINLRYLTKDIAFKEEQECRIIKIIRLNNNDKIKNDNYRMYVEYEPQVSKHIEKIYFGPKANGMELFQDFLTHKDLNIPTVKSDNPLS